MNKKAVIIGVVAGATVAAGVGAYFALPKQTKEDIKNFLENMSKKKSLSTFHDDLTK